MSGLKCERHAECAYPVNGCDGCLIVGLRADVRRLEQESESNYEGWRQADTELKGATAIVDAVTAHMAAFDARKPLPEMSQVATATLALSHCLDTIDAIRSALDGGE